jgi:hypothetical protein
MRNGSFLEGGTRLPQEIGDEWGGGFGGDFDWCTDLFDTRVVHYNHAISQL